MSTLISHRYQQVIEEMANLNWSALTRAELMAVAGAYHYYLPIRLTQTPTSASVCLWAGFAGD
jgi:hypothetical protein